jgi:hypothetical protein
LDGYGVARVEGERSKKAAEMRRKQDRTKRPRAGWAEQFRLMAERGDGKLIDEPVPTLWDETEWEWQLQEPTRRKSGR